MTGLRASELNAPRADIATTLSPHTLRIIRAVEGAGC